MKHYVPVGVQQDGVLDREGSSVRAVRDLNNERDWFSPAASFSPSSRGASMLLSPFVTVGPVTRPDDPHSEGRDDALSVVTYSVQLVLTFVASFVLTLALLTGRYIMLFSTINVAESAIYLSLLAAIAWYFLVRFWPFDRRVSPTLNPAIEVARLLVGDNQGLVACALNVGIIISGALLGGFTAGELGWKEVGGTFINEALPVGASASRYGMDFLLTTVVVLSYIVPKKLRHMGEDGEENWAKTTGSAAGALFVSTLIGVPLGFLWFNPATYLGAAIATGKVDINLTDGVLDSLIFVLVRILAAPAAAALIYYIIRFGVWLSERYSGGFTLRFGGSNGSRSTDTTVAPGYARSESAIRSSGLRQRQVMQEEMRKPLLNVDY